MTNEQTTVGAQMRTYSNRVFSLLLCGILVLPMLSGENITGADMWQECSPHLWILLACYGTLSIVAVALARTSIKGMSIRKSD